MPTTAESDDRPGDPLCAALTVFGAVPWPLSAATTVTGTGVAAVLVDSPAVWVAVSLGAGALVVSGALVAAGVVRVRRDADDERGELLRRLGRALAFGAAFAAAVLVAVVIVLSHYTFLGSADPVLALPATVEHPA